MRPVARARRKPAESEPVVEDQVVRRDDEAVLDPPHPMWWIVAPCALVACVVLFNLGHGAIDQAEPDKPAAGADYGAAVLAAIAGVAGIVLLRAPSRPVLILAAVLLGGLWALASFDATESYNEGRGTFLLFATDLEAFVLAVFVFTVVILVVVVLLRPEYTLRVLAGAILSGALAFGWLALVHLTQLDHQAELARDAYGDRSTPLLPAAALASALAFVAWLKRRS